MSNMTPLACSTKHLSCYTGAWLCRYCYRQESKHEIIRTSDGYAIGTKPGKNWEEYTDIPYDLIHIIRLAHKAGCEQIWFDSDAKHYPELPNYNDPSKSIGHLSDCLAGGDRRFGTVLKPTLGINIKEEQFKKYKGFNLDDVLFNNRKKFDNLKFYFAVNPKTVTNEQLEVFCTNSTIDKIEKGYLEIKNIRGEIKESHSPYHNEVIKNVRVFI